MVQQHNAKALTADRLAVIVLRSSLNLDILREG